MELNHDFKIGDEVYHVSSKKLIMAIEDVDQDRIECSFFNDKTKTIEFLKFNFRSLRKVDKGPTMSVHSLIV